MRVEVTPIAPGRGRLVVWLLDPISGGEVVGADEIVPLDPSAPFAKAVAAHVSGFGLTPGTVLDAIKRASR